ncbi:MAG: hypothetical protein OIF51_04655 [Cellvibrionaceae bacterium]|nr:hypothetical protein [Cellvibrionaceae bacterium]
MLFESELKTISTIFNQGGLAVYAAALLFYAMRFKNEIKEAITALLHIRARELARLEKLLDSPHLEDGQIKAELKEQRDKIVFLQTTGIYTDTATREALIDFTKASPYFTWAHIKVALRDLISLDTKSGLLTPVIEKVKWQRRLLRVIFYAYRLMGFFVFYGFFLAMYYGYHAIQAEFNGWETDYLEHSLTCIGLSIISALVADAFYRFHNFNKHAHLIVEHLKEKQEGQE